MERAKADDDDGNRAFGDGGGEEEEALLKKEITKLTKKAQTLTVINTALQEDKEDGNLTTEYWFLGSIVNGVRMSFYRSVMCVFIMQTFCDF